MPLPGVPNSRLTMKRPSNASISLFFKREPAVSRVWLFLTDPDSSSAAWYYANFMNYFLSATIIFTIWQAALEPPVSRFIEGIAQISIEAPIFITILITILIILKASFRDFRQGILFVEFSLHWFFSPERCAARCLSMRFRSYHEAL